METTDYKGIDYSLGASNKDNETGIRYGVISQNEVLQAWADSSQGVYFHGCLECGAEIPEEDEPEYCPACKVSIESPDHLWAEEATAFTYEGEGYICESDSYGDIFILASPYFTYAQFCSPCAPGAVHLGNPLSESDDNNKGYCFGHDWFEDGKAPYPVYSVKTGEEVKPD